tara:strand:+ start:153 stop:434 length:282 start_codon:yes stop_codon:yes gene_type:complete
MQTLKIETTTYSLASLGRIFEVQMLTSKITGKHKPVRPKAQKRTYPRFGDSLSTHAYVRDYYAMNALGETNHFAPLSKHLSVPLGVDSMEVEQ